MCGFDVDDPTCLCGLGFSHDTVVASCDGTAPTCCTQDTGYCYCEDGCELRFGNRPVTSCGPSTEAARCSSGETQVSSCE